MMLVYYVAFYVTDAYISVTEIHPNLAHNKYAWGSIGSVPKLTDGDDYSYTRFGEFGVLNFVAVDLNSSYSLGLVRFKLRCKMSKYGNHKCIQDMRRCTLIAGSMGPTWGPSGTDRTQVGPMLAPWTLLSRYERSRYLLELWYAQYVQSNVYMHFVFSYVFLVMSSGLCGRFISIIYACSSDSWPLYSLSGRAPYHNISQSLEVARFDFKLFP